ncbi:kinesin-like protein KIN-12F [Zea mays]|uniref:kinesin-like protein KIN-12F n=1 Tax=Zea mays TaxID=4577 RepID=UPI0016528DC3|nr:kinesin-like protein KIN-12F [Zea mays]
MEDGMVDLADSSRHPIDMHNELLCAQETIRILRREVSEKESEIAQCNAHISELNVHVEAVAQEYKHKVSASCVCLFSRTLTY